MSRRNNTESKSFEPWAKLKRYSGSSCIRHTLFPIPDSLFPAYTRDVLAQNAQGYKRSPMSLLENTAQLTISENISYLEGCFNRVSCDDSAITYPLQNDAISRRNLCLLTAPSGMLHGQYCLGRG